MIYSSVAWASTPMEATHEAAFAALCQRAFSNGDAVASAVLLGVERNDFAVGLRANPLPDAHVGPFKMALVEIGVPEGTQHLPEEHVAKMRELKNQQRALFHMHNTARQHQLVAELLRDCAVSEPSAPTPALCADPRSTVHAAARFVETHMGNIGAHSFIRGLRATLEQQLATPASCVIWRIPEPTLSQSGGEAFAHDAVNLMTALHFFVLEVMPHRPVAASDHPGSTGTVARDVGEDGWVDWQAHPQCSDRCIMAVLR